MTLKRTSCAWTDLSTRYGAERHASEEPLGTVRRQQSENRTDSKRTRKPHLQRQEEALNKALFALETHEESLDQISSSHLGLLLKTVHAPVGCWMERVRRSAEKSAEAHVAYVEQIALERQAVQMAAETAGHAASDDLHSVSGLDVVPRAAGERRLVAAQDHGIQVPSGHDDSADRGWCEVGQVSVTLDQQGSTKSAAPKVTSLLDQHA